MSKDDDAKQEDYDRHQLALVRWQTQAIKDGDKLAIVLEGRDAAGKDGAIRAITEHLSVRNTKVVALPKPSDTEQSQWFFQRYTHFLPGAGQTTIFNRSWYNRGGVERVMGFSTLEQQETFLRDAPAFEAMLCESGLKIAKFWLDVSRDEQARRLKERATDPLKALKRSPLDDAAQDRWEAYTKARDEMLTRTHTATSPWICVRSDHKKAARLQIIRHLVKTFATGKVRDLVDKPDPDILFPFEVSALADGRLER